uniref:Uncharacterized protein n=1 Tax=Arundo donax TaxID=35708 RepID=A0A0A8ZIR5_ARUDO
MVSWHRKALPDICSREKTLGRILEPGPCVL